MVRFVSRGYDMLGRLPGTVGFWGIRCFRDLMLYVIDVACWGCCLVYGFGFAGVPFHGAFLNCKISVLCRVDIIYL